MVATGVDAVTDGNAESLPPTGKSGWQLFQFLSGEESVPGLAKTAE